MKEAVSPGPARNPSTSKIWLRALELTAPIPRNPYRIFPSVIAELGERFGGAPALLSGRRCMTYRELCEESNRYSRWVLDQDIAKGDAVCLLMANSPEYLAIWIGITRTGAVVSLLNTNLSGVSLAHCINIVEPKHIIVSEELVDQLATAQPALKHPAKIWVHPAGIKSYYGEPLSNAERRPITIHDPALYVYTSGTTGLPKAANVSHFRIMQWSHWFAGMMDANAADRMYNCLPMYHSVGGVVATGAVLVGGGSVVIREKFSSTQFWNDIVRWDCSLFQYIGELCRHLLHTAPSANDTAHRIRLSCGNGLSIDIWNEFKARFRIPHILEFYAATEGNFSVFNAEGKPGSIGRIPPFLAHRTPVALVKFDVEKEEPVRDENGFCIPCARNEAGEALGKIAMEGSQPIGRFEGYRNAAASERKILRHVFEPGDAWFRTGDLLRKDEQGYFYFVDRVGDTFRWKAENVATCEVSAAICAFPGVWQADVYGVRIPFTDGRACMAALTVDGELDLAALRSHLIDQLPAYARPLFLRMRRTFQTTATFKSTKTDLVREGYDPSTTCDLIYFNDPDRKALIPMDRILFDRIQQGQVRL